MLLKMQESMNEMNESMDNMNIKMIKMETTIEDIKYGILYRY